MADEKGSATTGPAASQPLGALPDFNKLWNYDDPAATGAKFRALLPAAERSGDVSYHAQLLTQIARTQGLQNKFDEAHATLDGVEKLLASGDGDLSLARVRYLLERGRVFNSSGQAENALPLFHEAAELATARGHTGYVLDAVHMVAIAIADPKEQVEWNLKGIRLVESSSGPRGWLPAFYNNLGEAYLLLKEYENALDSFRKMADLEVTAGREPEMMTTKDIAKCTRLAGRPEEALKIIDPIHSKLAGESNGFASEELAECLLALGREDEARPHFAKAHELLSKIPWMAKQTEHMERMKRLAVGHAAEESR